jgi:hypothetical protein
MEKVDLDELIETLVNRESVGISNWSSNADRLASALPEVDESEHQSLLRAVVTLFKLCPTKESGISTIFMAGLELGRELERRVVD